MSEKDVLNDLIENTFLKELEEIKKSDYINPKDSLESKVVVAGQMNNLEKSLYALSSRKRKFAELTRIKVQFDNCSTDETKGLYLAYLSLRGQDRLLQHMMWVSIKDRFNLWDKSVGVRNDFKVVWWEDSIIPSSVEVVKGILTGNW